MNSRWLNRFIALAGIALAGAMALNASSFPERAAAAARYVHFLAATMTLFSVILLLQSFRPHAPSQVEWVRARKPFLAAVAGLLCYVPLLSILGFFPASFVFMTATGRLLGFRNLKFLFLGTGGTLLFIYVVFVRFLQVPVPTGLIGG